MRRCQHIKGKIDVSRNDYGKGGNQLISSARGSLGGDRSLAGTLGSTRRRRAAVLEGRCVHDALGALTGPSNTELRIGVAAAAGCEAVTESKHVQIKSTTPTVPWRPSRTPRGGGHGRRGAHHARPGRQGAHDRRAGAGPDEIGAEDVRPRRHSCGDAAARSRGVLRPGAVADPAHARAWTSSPRSRR